MEPFTCPGVYLDDQGREEITWSFEPATHSDWQDSYEISAVIRGVRVRGGDFDGLEPETHGVLPQDDLSELTGCVLSGELPCLVLAGEVIVARSVAFVLDLRRGDVPWSNLTLSCVVKGVEYAITDSWFEDGLQRLDQSLPDGVGIRACVTCLFSDYSPYGHGLMGMRCHRDVKKQYLAVRSKVDYFEVPVTEDVPETYFCPQYQQRIPGTGYRG